MNKTYAIADIHGMYNLWRQVIDYLDETDTLYVLGDCADRGGDGWKIIKEALADPRVVYIRGNHDQMLIDTVKNPWDYNTTSLWYYNGGGITNDDMLADPNYEVYVDQLAKTRHSVCYHNTNKQTIYLTHAGFTLHKDGEMPWNEDLLWDREHIADNWPEGRENEYVVHGHTPVISSCWKLIDIKEGKYSKSNPTIIRYAQGHKICIDLGAAWTNKTILLDLDTLLPIYFKGEK